MSVSVGLKTKPAALKEMLGKTGFNLRKLAAEEKLDLLVFMAEQVEYHIETRGRMHLKLKENPQSTSLGLINMLENEDMRLSDQTAPSAVIALFGLVARERERLVYASSDSEEEKKRKAAEIEEELQRKSDAILVIASEVYDIFGEYEIADARARHHAKHSRGQEPSSAAVVERGPDPSSRNEDEEPPLKRRCRSWERLEDAKADPSSASSEQLLMLEDMTPEKIAKEEAVLAKIDPDAIREHLPRVGYADDSSKDNLMEIRGIGPWIQKRLNRIKIFRHSQLAKMDERIMKAVADAIRFWPRRIQHDHWVWQAERLANGKGWIVNPPITRSGVSNIITISGQKYERELMDIAQHYGKDGATMNLEHAECLWFSALDGQGVTPTERLTLNHIMDKRNFKFDEAAHKYLTDMMSKRGTLSI